MDDLILLKHRKGAPGLRLLGLGPKFIPVKGLAKLHHFLNKNASWAQRRSKSELRKMLSQSQVIVSIWHNNDIIGFGRAMTDKIYRAVLWDIVIDQSYQYRGLGKQVVTTILTNKLISKVEKVYLMTTHCEEFYLKMNFKIVNNQSLMILDNK